MAKLTIGQKATRVVQLLMGLRNRRVAAALKEHGFGDDDLARGWSLLQELTRNKLAVTVAPKSDPRLTTELDRWENRWFPIADIVLATNSPEAHAMVFKNLSQTDGPEVIVSVGTFLDRLEALPKSREEGGLGATGRSARELLVKRGLDSNVVAEARAWLEKVGKIDPSELDMSGMPSERDEKLERDLWNWYLEWSGIARIAISDRRLLRTLGFLRGSSSSSQEPEFPEEPGDGPSEE